VESLAIEEKRMDRDFQPGDGPMMFSDEPSNVVLKDYGTQGQPRAKFEARECDSKKLGKIIQEQANGIMRGSAQGWSNAKSKSPSIYPHIATTTTPRVIFNFQPKLSQKTKP
jgi:hypothetical protein